jgi:hypothetical protein
MRLRSISGPVDDDRDRLCSRNSSREIATPPPITEADDDTGSLDRLRRRLAELTTLCASPALRTYVDDASVAPSRYAFSDPNTLDLRLFLSS